MKIVFTCDLHGRRHLYEEMFQYAVSEGAECIIIGGDLLPTWLKSPYKLLTGGIDFQEALHVQISFIDSFLKPAMVEFTARHPDIRIFYVPGNHDWNSAIKHLKASVSQAVCLHLRKETLGDITFAGYGCVTDSSFWVKDYVRRDMKESSYIRSRYPLVSAREGIEISLAGAYALQRPSIEEELVAFAFPNPAKTICVFHCPPYGTGLDTLYSGKAIGSRSIAEFIKESTPFVSMHGHIHEAPYMSGRYHTMIGPTLAINPGHHPRKLHAVSFDTDDPGTSLSHRVSEQARCPGRNSTGQKTAMHGYSKAFS